MWPAPSACLSDGPGHEAGRSVFSLIRLIKLVVLKKKCFYFSVRVTSISSESYQIVSRKIVGHLSTFKHWRPKGFSVLFGFPFNFVFTRYIVSSIVLSSIKPKFDDQFFVVFMFCTSCKCGIVCRISRTISCSKDVN